MNKIKYFYTLRELLEMATSERVVDTTFNQDIYLYNNENKIMAFLYMALKDSLMSPANKEFERYFLLIVNNRDNQTSAFYTWQTFLYYRPESPSGWSINQMPQVRLLYLLLNRFGQEYIPFENEIDNPVNNTEVKEFARKFLSIMLQTYPRYYPILKIYDDNLSKLMNPLKTTHTGLRNTARHEDYDTDMSGKNILNDAPQTTDVVTTLEQDQYASELSKSTAHTDNIGDVSEAVQDATTTEQDSMTTMAKIKEIQDSYDLMLKKWSNEFETLFMEEI